MKYFINPKTILFVTIVFLMGLEIASLVSINLIGIRQIPSPHAIFSTLNHHFYLEALLGILFGGGFFLLSIVWYKGGVSRVISQLISGFFLAAFISFYLGFQGFLSYEQVDLQSLDNILSSLNESDTLREHFFIAELISASIVFFIVCYLIWEQVRPERKALGNAHFSNGLEVQKTGFFKKEEGAILIGKKYGVPLWSNGFEHVLVFAPPGSGKTSSIGMPNLFQYPYSIVCNDVKLTMFKTTSGYREKILGNKCYCWAPTNKISHRFNPLSFISEDKLARMTDIQRIAHILMPENKKDPIWSQASRKLFKTIVLYLLDTPEKTVTLGEINRVIKHPSFDSWLSGLLNETEHYDPEFYRNGFSYVNNHDKTRGSIKESFSGYFELFDDPTIDAATSATDFDITSLRREKTTIYIGFTDDDMERLSPLLTLFWQQLISSMIHEIPDLDKEPYPVLCLIDEFSSLGRIERLRRSLKLLREYRVRCVLMMQYIAQTFEQYSHDEARAFTNMKTKIAYSVDDVQDAEYISKLLGMRTKRVRSGSLSSKDHGYSESRSYNYQAIPLLRPDEVMRFPDKNTLIIRTGYAPVKARQFIWYKESEMKSRALEQSFVPSLEVSINPFNHKEKKGGSNGLKSMKDSSKEASEFI